MDTHSFLFQAMVYLGSAVLMVPIAKKLGLGSVLGYLIAGIIMGPFILKFIGEEGENLLHFAEFGVVMMLFLIGLELEPALLWKLRRAILGLGGLQVISASIGIGAIAMLFGFNWQQSLAIGMTLSLSSTAIVMQSLTEKGLMKSASGQSAFAVLLFQDVAVIPMLSIFPLLVTLTKMPGAEHEATSFVGSQPAWLQTLIVLGTIVVIIVAGQFIVRPLLRIIARTALREIFTAFALFLVVGTAVLMTAVGLSPALGAFLAGVVLANSEYRHELESDIEPFKGLLLGLFFIAVGASINFRLILEQPLLILGLVLLLMLVKLGLALLLGKLFKLSKDQNLLFSFALCQGGEFAFVLLSFSAEEGILASETVSLLVAVVAMSMALAPLVMLLNDKLFMPTIKKQVEEEREADEIDERNQVIIAGFGHFGSTLGRFLRANNIQATYLDIDSDRVTSLRKMGLKVFYGDASRYDLLQAAGAASASYIVVAMDSEEKRMELIETVKKHFPNLRMLVRATNRYDAYELMNAGMLHIYRETVDTSLRMGVDLMKMMGYRAYTAHRASQTFFKYDEANLKKLSAIRDPDEYILAVRGTIEELEEQLRDDIHHSFRDPDAGWDPESLRRESRGE